MNEFVCLPKRLPTYENALVARDHNPVNAPPAWVTEPERIAVLTTKYWGPVRHRFTVSFTERAPYQVRLAILRNMNAWRDGGCGVRFVYTSYDRDHADVRITREAEGYWSYVGTDNQSIPAGEPTMSLQEFSDRTPTSEYHRVVRHETGHYLGCPHEHMRRAIIARLDRNRTIAWGARALGWDAQTVVEQILTPVEESSLMGGSTDEDSIMCYALPASITTDGRPVVGGADITANDQSFINRIYPR